MNGDDQFQMLEESSRKEYIHALLHGNHLSGAAEGIAKLVLDQGEAALKGGQIEVYQKYVLGHEAGKSCKICGQVSDFGEMAFIVDDKDDYCSIHRAAMDKD